MQGPREHGYECLNFINKDNSGVCEALKAFQEGPSSTELVSSERFKMYGARGNPPLDTGRRVWVGRTVLSGSNRTVGNAGLSASTG